MADVLKTKINIHTGEHTRVIDERLSGISVIQTGEVYKISARRQATITGRLTIEGTGRLDLTEANARMNVIL